MKILHTADWHLGQLFYEYDSTYEHQHFLNWIRGTLSSENIEALLISGDIFDLSNPSAASIKMFYTFLNQAVKDNPYLQIIITAGNHDISIPTEFYSIIKDRQKRKNASLEERTGTRIYSEISQLIFVHYSQGKRVFKNKTAHV